MLVSTDKTFLVCKDIKNKKYTLYPFDGYNFIKETLECMSMASVSDDTTLQYFIMLNPRFLIEKGKIINAFSYISDTLATSTKVKSFKNFNFEFNNDYQKELSGYDIFKMTTDNLPYMVSELMGEYYNVLLDHATIIKTGWIFKTYIISGVTNLFLAPTLKAEIGCGYQLDNNFSVSLSTQSKIKFRNLLSEYVDYEFNMIYDVTI